MTATDQTKATSSPAEWADVARRKHEHYKTLCDRYELGQPVDVAIVAHERNLAEMVPHLADAIDRNHDTGYAAGLAAAAEWMAMFEKAPVDGFDRETCQHIADGMRAMAKSAVDRLGVDVAADR